MTFFSKRLFWHFAQAVSYTHLRAQPHWLWSRTARRRKGLRTASNLVFYTDSLRARGASEPRQHLTKAFCPWGSSLHTLIRFFRVPPGRPKNKKTYHSKAFAKCQKRRFEKKVTLPGRRIGHFGVCILPNGRFSADPNALGPAKADSLHPRFGLDFFVIRSRLYRPRCYPFFMGLEVKNPLAKSGHSL